MSGAGFIPERRLEPRYERALSPVEARAEQLLNAALARGENPIEQLREYLARGGNRAHDD